MALYRESLHPSHRLTTRLKTPTIVHTATMPQQYSNHRPTERDAALRAPRPAWTKDSGGAGAETPTAPSPYPGGQRGRSPRIWVAPRSDCALVPKALGREHCFLSRNPGTGEMHPPFLFFLKRETGRARSKEKTLCSNLSSGKVGDAVFVKRRRAEICQAYPSALYAGDQMNVQAARRSLGQRFVGGQRMGWRNLPVHSASLWTPLGKNPAAIFGII